MIKRLTISAAGTVVTHSTICPCLPTLLGYVGVGMGVGGSVASYLEPVRDFTKPVREPFAETIDSFWNEVKPIEKKNLEGHLWSQHSQSVAPLPNQEFVSFSPITNAYVEQNSGMVKHNHEIYHPYTDPTIAGVVFLIMVAMLSLTKKAHKMYSRKNCSSSKCTQD